ncbi:hypothetical protein E3P99_03395 [Wallemia hederae]|uniref:Major facilitator superfamily (MFS) profile domain-containing protein n=1 Tax=Wallemia hederae TaxID=1540922 RepID=A0A4T0FIC2_9BASI|nr:hypothetical protein E3P99_03395 [Wallemia hederae]
MVTGRILFWVSALKHLFYSSGLSMAGGSVTIAVVADMWGPDNHQYGLAYVVWSSVSAAAIAPLVGGFIRVYAQPGPSWRWIFYVEIIKGVACQLACFFLPETRSTILLDREAQRRRKEAAKQGIELNIWGPNEVKEQRITLHEIVEANDQIPGFSDMLIFIFLDSFADVFGQWGFTPWQTGLCFVSILVAYLLVWGSYLPFFRSAEKKRSRGVNVAPEERLYWLLWLAPLEAIGLFGFAWTSLGPDRGVHWFGPVFFAGVIGIANYAIYMSTVDYMVAAYGEYSASACGGNGFARDFLSGIAAMFATPFYKHFPRYTLEYPTTILACIAVVLIVPIFLLYFYGPTVRKNSKFAMTLANERESTNIRHQVREEKAKTSQHIEHSA